MKRIGKPEALGPLDENMETDEDDDEGTLDDGVDIADDTGDALAAALGAAHI